MDVLYTLNEIDFIWDREKARINQQKHQIDFKIACEAFFDPFLHNLDDEVIEGELRERVIGMSTAWQLLYVVYTLRNDRIRLISARRVTRPERKIYEDQ